MACRCLTIVGLAIVATGCGGQGVQADEAADGVDQTPADSAPPATPTDTTTASVGEDRPWTVPAGWTEDPEPRQMRLATYMAPDPDGLVEVAVSRFSGRVGGDLANINRWRGQMGLGPVAESELDDLLTRFSADGFDGYLIRIESDTGVMLASGVYEQAIDQMWFIRATIGDTAAADRLEADLFGMARSIAGRDLAGEG